MTNPDGPDEGWSTGGFPVPARPPIPGYPDPGSAAVADGGRQGRDPDGQPAPLAGWPQYPSPQYPSPQYPSPHYPAHPAQQSYAQQSYPQQSYPAPAGLPGYPGQVGYPGQAGYPGHPGYPGYAGYPLRAARPGTVTGAAVLAFIAGGFDLIGALIMLLALTAAAGPTDSFWSSGVSIATLGAAAAGAALIAGGVRMLRGLPALLYVGAGLTVAVALYWFAVAADIDDPAGRAGLRVYPMLYVALVVVMAGLALSRSARQWRPDGPRHG